MSLIEKGYKINLVSKDLGNGLAILNGNEDINIVSQSDLFHLLVKFKPPLGKPMVLLKRRKEELTF